MKTTAQTTNDIQSNNRSSVLIVVPTLGQRLDMLQQTLDSLTSQEAHTPDIVVVCPKDRKSARALAAQYGARLADDPGGISAAVNVGFSMAKPWHIYSSWIGDDDLLRPKSLATSVSALEANTDAVLAFGYCDYINDDGTVLFTSKAGKLAPLIMRWGPNLVPLPGILYRHAAIKKTGDFDPNLKYAMDLDMLLRLRKQGRFISTGRTLGAFRWHAASTTVANRQASLKEAETVKLKYMPKAIRPLSFMWQIPVQFATKLAVRTINSK